MIKRIDDIEEELILMQKRKDKVLDISRSLIRLAGKSITFMHARDMKKAKLLLGNTEELVRKLQKEDKGFEYNSQQAYQEYAEAAVLYSIINSGKIPTDKDLGIDSISYMLGLLDTVGELKREIFEALRKNDVKSAESLFGFMSEIHDSMLPLRFSSSLVGDLRKKQDTARIQLENASSELLSFRKKSS
jgi:translin